MVKVMVQVGAVTCVCPWNSSRGTPRPCPIHVPRSHPVLRAASRLHTRLDGDTLTHMLVHVHVRALTDSSLETVVVVVLELLGFTPTATPATVSMSATGPAAVVVSSFPPPHAPPMMMMLMTTTTL